MLFGSLKKEDRGGLQSVPMIVTLLMISLITTFWWILLSMAEDSHGTRGMGIS